MATKMNAAFFIKVARCACIATLAVSAFFVVTQDFQVFPFLVVRPFIASYTPPHDIDLLTPTSSDGSPVLVWRLRAPVPQPKVALIFHGNSSNVAMFQPVQRWLASQGITTYSMEFRGYSGSDSGWPSEQALYEDAEVVFKLMLREEKIEASQAMVLGNSIGTGIASHIAAQYHPKVLVLLSPYTSLPDVVARYRLLGFLTPFMWYEFPSERNISALHSTCVVAAHGRQDTTIPFNHSEKLQQAYVGEGTFTLLESSEAGHNDLLASVHNLISEAVQRCFERTKTSLKLN
jgi:predicted esterase